MDGLDTGSASLLQNAIKSDAELEYKQQENKRESFSTSIGRDAALRGAVKQIHVTDSRNAVPADEITQARVTTGICSRQIEGVEQKHTMPGGASVAETGVNEGQREFAYWLDRFLSIPLDEFIPINIEIKKKIHECYKKGIERIGDGEMKKIAQKRVLIGIAVYDWQKSQGDKQVKEQTEAKLVSLCNSVEAEFNISAIIQSWVLLKVYRDSLYGETISDEDRQCLLGALNEDLFHSGTGISENVFKGADIYALQVFYFFGLLPGFENGLNYQKGFDLLLVKDGFIENFYCFLSPVSFTLFDHARFSISDLKVTKSRQGELHLTGTLNSVMQMIILGYMQGEQLNDEHFNRWLSRIDGFSFCTYTGIRNVMSRFAILMGQMDTRKAKSAEIQAIKSLILQSKHDADLKKIKSVGDYFSLFTYMQVELILKEKKQHRRTLYAQAAGLYQKIAKESPNHWCTVYSFYHKAAMWNQSAAAADSYSQYWKDKNQVLSEYWNDISYRELLLNQSYDLDNRKSSSSEQNYDIDAVLKEFYTTPGESEKDKNVKQPVRGGSAKRKQGKRNCISSSSASFRMEPEAHQIENESIHEKNRVSAEGKQSLCNKVDHPSYKPVIKCRPSVENRHGTWPDGGMYQVKSARGSIQPFEKLLSRNWNPLVRKVLASITQARASSDINKEHAIYKRLMENQTLKACIGIERIWEECAWTELHRFDDFFRVGAISHSMKAEAGQWINKSRELYILPSLAHFMELDQINTDIKPEEVWTAVAKLLDCSELAPPDINQEIRFRLRCLFSSMGHTYSISGMIASKHSKHLRNIAQQWYGLKSIDQNYVQRARKGHDSVS